MRFLIYGLFDTRPERFGELRYIGKSSSGMRRPQEHARTAQSMQTHSAKWVRALHARGLKYEIDILEQVEQSNELGAAEQRAIAYYRAIGCDLTNMTAGGDGGLLGLKRAPFSQATRDRMRAGQLRREKRPPPTEETREKMRRAQTGKKRNFSPEVLLRISHLGKKRRPESIAKLSAANRGKKWSPGQRAKMSVAMKGRKFSEEAIKKIRELAAQRRGKRPCSEETKEKLRRANKGQIVSPEQRAKISAALAGRAVHPVTERQREVTGARYRGKHLPSSTREKIRLAITGMWAGEKHFMAKLTAGQVIEIRALAAADEAYKDLSLKFGVSIFAIGKIVRRETWRHI